MECMSPLSMLALSKLDMASIVQFLRALKLELVRFRPSAHFSSVASSEQSFSKFMNRVKNLKSYGKYNNLYNCKININRKLLFTGRVQIQ